MKIRVRVDINPEVTDRLMNTGDWEPLLENGMYLELDWPSDKTKRVLDIIAGAPVNLHHAHMKFTKAEIDNSSYLEMDSRQIVNISNTDQKLYDEQCNVQQAKEKNNYFNPKRLIATTIKLSEPSVASYGGFSEELITTLWVYGVLKSSGLSGWKKQNIHKKDKSTHQIYVRLNSPSVIHVNHTDMSIFRIVSGPFEELVAQRHNFDVTPPYLRYFGCKTIVEPKANEIRDFNRLWANEYPDGYATWIISNKAMNYLKASKIRGLSYAPLLIDGTDMYLKYNDLWDGLMAKLVGINATYSNDPIQNTFA